VSIQGSPYARFQRSLETRKLSVVLAAAAELQAIQLDDALEILIIMAVERDPRFDRAAARWVGRLLAETPVGLADARWALALVERLPTGAESLRRLRGVGERTVAWTRSTPSDTATCEALTPLRH
jgi:hypothetical protein